MQDFTRRSHAVAQIILQKIATHLGLDPQVLLDLHTLEAQSGDQVRLTHVAPAPTSAFAITLGAHTDYGSVTILFNKLGGLQVMPPSSTEWKYVRPEPDCAIVNLGDALVKLLGGRVHSGLHRVVTAPGDQATLPRTSVVYFARPNGSVPLTSVFAGDEREATILTADEWIKKRVFFSNTLNYKDAETAKQGLGTEHTQSNL